MLQHIQQQDSIELLTVQPVGEAATVQIGSHVALEGASDTAVRQAVDASDSVAFQAQFGSEKAFAAAYIEDFTAAAGQLLGIVVAGITPGL